MNRNTDMMTCEEYKLAQTADPAFDGGGGHLAECADCRAYRDELQSLNDRIAQALTIAVPDLQVPDLPALDAENVTVFAGRRAISKPAWFAIAASVMLATFIGIRFSAVDETNESLTDQLLAHMDHEPYAYRSTKAVSDKRLARIVPANIATMNHDAGLITYAQSCRINGTDVPHLVMQGKKGPITILLMPEEAISDVTAIEGESIHGFIYPVGGGSIAIIGEKEERLDDVKKNVVESVTWST